MPSNNSEVIAATFCEVLEKLAFMFGETLDKSEMPEPDGNYSQVSIHVSGPMSGAVTLVAAPEACAEIAANILGLDSGDTLAEERAEDALKELVNVTCGSLLTAIAGTDPVFHISVPVAATIDADAWREALDSPDSQAFMADDHPVLLHVVLN